MTDSRLAKGGCLTSLPLVDRGTKAQWYSQVQGTVMFHVGFEREIVL